MPNDVFQNNTVIGCRAVACGDVPFREPPLMNFDNQNRQLPINLTPRPPLRIRRGGVERQRDGGEVKRTITGVDIQNSSGHANGSCGRFLPH